MNEVFSFSTQDIFNDSKVEATEESLLSFFPSMTVKQTDTQSFHAEFKSFQIESLILANLSFSPLSLAREECHLQDGDDAFSFVSCFKGGYDVVLPTGDSVKVSPGMASLISHRHSSRTCATTYNEAKTLVLPRDLLRQVISNPDQAVGRMPKGGSAALGILIGYMEATFCQKHLMTNLTKRLVEGQLLDLLANAFDPEGEWSQEAPYDGVKIAQRKQLMTLMASEYFNLDISAKKMGIQVGVSTRGVHLLLEETGLTFSEHILEHRLQAARRMLLSRRFVNLRILDIALKVGFSDISYFNRTFRKRFGDAPSTFRSYL